MANINRTDSLPLDRRPSDERTASTIREVTRAARNLLEAPVIAALQRPPVTITFQGTSTQRVFHGLGRTPVGYLVARRTAGEQLFDGNFPTGEDPTQVIYLSSTNTCTYTVYFV